MVSHSDPPEALTRRFVFVAIVMSGVAALFSWAIVTTEYRNAALICAFLPLLAAIVLGAAKRVVHRPFLLLPALAFFQQNDALSQWVGGLPVAKILAASAVLWLLATLSAERVRATLIEGRLIFVCLIGLQCVFLMSAISAISPEIALEESGTLAKNIIFALLIAFGVRDTRDVVTMALWLVLASGFSSAIMVFDAMNGTMTFENVHDADWQGVIRSSGASLESVPMAASMVLGGAVIAANLAIRRPEARVLNTTITLLAFAAILASITRSAILTSGLICLYLIWRARKEPAFPAIITVSLVLALVVLMALPQSVASKFGALSDPSEDTTVLRRVSYLIIGVDSFKQSPLLGIGAGNFAERYADDEYRFVAGRSEEPRPLHNQYLQYATETGIVGAALFLTLVWRVGIILYRTARRSTGVLRAHAEALFLAHIATAMQMLYLSSKSIFYLWLMVGLSVALARLQAEQKSSPEHPL